MTAGGNLTCVKTLFETPSQPEWEMDPCLCDLNQKGRIHALFTGGELTAGEAGIWKMPEPQAGSLRYG